MRQLTANNICRENSRFSHQTLCAFNKNFNRLLRKRADFIRRLNIENVLVYEISSARLTETFCLADTYMMSKILIGNNFVWLKLKSLKPQFI